MRYALGLLAVALVMLAANAGDAAPVDSNEAVNDYVKQVEAEALRAKIADPQAAEPLTEEEMEALYRLGHVAYGDQSEEESPADDEFEIDLEPPSAENDSTESADNGAEEFDSDEAGREAAIHNALLEAMQRDEESDYPNGNGEIEMIDDDAAAPINEESIAPTTTTASPPKQAGVKKGEKEYESFVDPAYIANARANAPNVAVKRMSELHFNDDEFSFTQGNMIFIGVVGICAVIAFVGTIVAGVAFYKLRSSQAAAERDNMYGVTAAAAERMARARAATTARGDQSNAYSAQLQHYQQTKNEIIRIEQASESGAAGAVADDESDAENEEPDYSVYECPGLAPTGDIEVSNPIFDQKQ